MSATPVPLPPDHVDELLSAELDGEFDAAAAGLGYAPAEARARLDSTPGVEQRRTLLGTARDALREPVPLDELQQARLRNAALRGASDEADTRARERRAERRRVLIAAAGIAAACAGVIAVVAGLNRTHTTKSASSSASTAAPKASAAKPESNGAAPAGLDYGNFPNVDALAGRLQAAARSSEAAGSATAWALRPAPGSDTTSFSSAGQTPPVATGASATSGNAGTGCAAAEAQLAPSARLVARGRATVAGAPVLVSTWQRGSETLVLVLTPECALVNRQVIG